jgi:cation:H+ antiporter
MLLLNIFIFTISFFILFFSTKWIVNSLLGIVRILGWKEFVAAFLFFAISASLPNLFVGITSALNEIPELSLGDVIGGNIIDLTIIMGISVLISKVGIPAPSKIVQDSALYLVLLTILFSLLVQDNTLSRADGAILLLTFIFYMWWLFIKKERFKKIYDATQVKISFHSFFKSLGVFWGSFILILISCQGIVASSKFFANYFNFHLCFFGLIVISWINALPELFFSIESAKRKQGWMILGELIGSVIITLTLVLGIVSLISPIKIYDPSAILLSRLFLLISILFFTIFLRSKEKLSLKEGKTLILLYFIYLFFEIILKK